MISNFSCQDNIKYKIKMQNFAKNEKFLQFRSTFSTSAPVIKNKLETDSDAVFCALSKNAKIRLARISLSPYSGTFLKKSHISKTVFCSWRSGKIIFIKSQFFS